MSLDYWRNEDKSCTLSFNVEGNYILTSEEYGQLAFCKLTRQDMVNLRNSLDHLLMDQE